MRESNAVLYPFTESAGEKRPKKGAGGKKNRETETRHEYEIAAVRSAGPAAVNLCARF